MHHNAIKQLDNLMTWFELNDVDVADVVITLKTKNDETYRILNDGSIIAMTQNDNKTYKDADELIEYLTKKTMTDSTSKDSRDSIFKITVKERD